MKERMVHGLPYIDYPDHKCEGCIYSQHFRNSFPKESLSRSTRPLQLVYDDIRGLLIHNLLVRIYISYYLLMILVAKLGFIFWEKSLKLLMCLKSSKCWLKMKVVFLLKPCEQIEVENSLLNNLIILSLMAFEDFLLFHGHHSRMELWNERI